MISLEILLVILWEIVGSTAIMTTTTTTTFRGEKVSY